MSMREIKKECFKCGYLHPEFHNRYKCCCGDCPALKKERDDRHYDPKLSVPDSDCALDY